MRTLVMGIVNVTPDSFSGDGFVAKSRDHTEACDRAVVHALRLLDEGATILDLGGESTRPGSGAGSARAVSAAEEQARLLPVIAALLEARPGAILSVDTYRAATAQAALAAGAEIVNDVSGFLWDERMGAVCAKAQAGVVLTHTRGRPDEWKTLPPLAPGEVVPLVLAELGDRLRAAIAAGISPEQIVLDPGYGFGKAFDANYALLHGQHRLLALGRPLLAGVSRKSFLGRTLGRLPADRNDPSGHVPAGFNGGASDVPPAGREHATLAAGVAAILGGASVLRVHSVRPAVEAAAIADAILSGGAQG